MRGQIKILYAEDESSIAEAVEARLSIEGYEIIIAADGQAAVEAARKKPPDLILLDVMLPKISGFEVCQVLKKDPNTRQIPIIMVTALDRLKDSKKAFECGANDYVTKPFEYARLIAKIKRLTSAPR